MQKYDRPSVLVARVDVRDIYTIYPNFFPGMGVWCGGTEGRHGWLQILGVCRVIVQGPATSYCLLGQSVFCPK